MDQLLRKFGTFDTKLKRICVETGSAEKLETLLRRKCEKLDSIAVFQSWNPLQSCCYHGYSSCVKVLVEHNADLYYGYEDGLTPLHIACWRGKLESVGILVQLGKVDVNYYSKWGYTALHIACCFGHLAIVRFLISNGANIGLRDKLGCCCLQLAAQHRQSEVLRYLVSLVPARPSPGSVNTSSCPLEINSDALSAVVSVGYSDVLEGLLVRAGHQTLLSRDMSGNLPVQYALLDAVPRTKQNCFPRLQDSSDGFAIVRVCDMHGEACTFSMCTMDHSKKQGIQPSGQKLTARARSLLKKYTVSAIGMIMSPTDKLHEFPGPSETLEPSDEDVATLLLKYFQFSDTQSEVGDNGMQYRNALFEQVSSDLSKFHIDNYRHRMTDPLTPSVKNDPNSSRNENSSTLATSSTPETPPIGQRLKPNSLFHRLLPGSESAIEANVGGTNHSPNSSQNVNNNSIAINNLRSSPNSTSDNNINVFNGNNSSSNSNGISSGGNAVRGSRNSSKVKFGTSHPSQSHKFTYEEYMEKLKTNNATFDNSIFDFTSHIVNEVMDDLVKRVVVRVGDVLSLQKAKSKSMQAICKIESDFNQYSIVSSGSENRLPGSVNVEGNISNFELGTSSPTELQSVDKSEEALVTTLLTRDNNTENCLDISANKSVVSADVEAIPYIDATDNGFKDVVWNTTNSCIDTTTYINSQTNTNGSPDCSVNISSNLVQDVPTSAINVGPTMVLENSLNPNTYSSTCTNPNTTISTSTNPDCNNPSPDTVSCHSPLSPNRTSPAITLHAVLPSKYNWIKPLPSQDETTHAESNSENNKSPIRHEAVIVKSPGIKQLSQLFDRGPNATSPGKEGAHTSGPLKESPQKKWEMRNNKWVKIEK